MTGPSRWRLTIASAGTLALSATIALSGLTAAAAAAAEPDNGPERTLHTVNLSTVEAAAAGDTATKQSVAAPASESCTTPSADLRRQPTYYVGCFSLRAATPSDFAARAKASAAAGAGARAAAYTVWCDGAGPQLWWYTRTEVCIYGQIGVYTFWLEPTHEIVGTATYFLSHDINTNPGPSADIQENAFVEQIAGTKIGITTDVSFTAKCTGRCITYDGDGFSGKMTVGNYQEALFSYTDNPVVGTPDAFRLQYTLTVVPPSGGSTNQPIRYEFPTDIRCDQPAAANARAGCVVPLYQPTLELPLAQYGAGAANIAIAQNYFPDGWGLTTPLSREASRPVQDSNRQAICEDGTFVYDPAIPADSCDEFAFAASKQSGAAFGLTGIDCAEVTPVFEDGQWFATIWTDNFTERCVRGHVPLPENSAVGGELGRFTQSERLLDNDKYLVAIV